MIIIQVVAAATAFDMTGVIVRLPSMKAFTSSSVTFALRYNQ